MSWKTKELDTLLAEDVDDVVERGRSLKGKDRTAALRDALSSLPTTTDPATRLSLLLFIQTLLAFVPDRRLTSDVAVRVVNELAQIVLTASAEVELKRSAMRGIALVLAKARDLPATANDRVREALTAAEGSADPEISSFARRAFEGKKARASRNRIKVLLIHGRDELNVHRLEKFIRERWDASVVVLNDSRAAGHRLIERFEEKAANADMAMVLLTPDDIADAEGARQRVPRSNVIFELGLACGRLGRSRVWVLLKQGTMPPSDLEGIRRLDFADNVLDVSPQLHSELDSTSRHADMLETA
jgi:predicted nucleotide-binding protein